MTLVYCGQTTGWIKMPLGVEVGLGPGGVVLDGNPAPPSPKMGRSPLPNFRPCPLWPNCWMDQDSTWHRGGAWSRPHCARWGPSSPPPKRGRSPHFSAHVYCGQMDGCIKMPLGMEVGLSPGDFVLDGAQSTPPHKGGGAPNFWANVYCGQTAAWIRMLLGTDA